jgi:guanylate kinase
LSNPDEGSPVRNAPPLFVVAGPSGCGKTTIAREIMRRHPQILFSVSATTRTKRAIETDGKDYFFLSKPDFKDRIARDELVEWEEIYGDYYGTLKSEVDRAIGSLTPMLFDVDVKGALSIRKRYPLNALLIFIKPPSLEILIERLRNRKTETPETFARRIERVTMELGMADQFDVCIVNNILETAWAEADAIVEPLLAPRAH